LENKVRGGDFGREVLREQETLGQFECLGPEARTVHVVELKKEPEEA
jgi:hypothetical protein